MAFISRTSILTLAKEFRRQLELLREKEKDMIRSDRAVVCATEWSVQGSKTEGKKMTRQTHKLMLRAFNGECDAALAKACWDNVLKMEERINKAFEMINKSGEVNRSHITEEYLDPENQGIAAHLRAPGKDQTGQRRTKKNSRRNEG